MIAKATGIVVVLRRKKRPELGLFSVAGERKRQPGFLSAGSFEIELFDFDTCAQGEHDDNHQRGCHVCQE